jgi:hypothetical protein
MLGRHVYRVSLAGGVWNITKEGETAAGAGQSGFVDREAALAEACRRAEADKPSRVIVDDGDGKILEEQLFGSDLSQELGS